MSCSVCEVKALAKNSRKGFLDTLFITFMITNDCNFKCSYCFETNKQHSYLKEEDALQVIDRMFDFEDNLDYWKCFYNKEHPIKFIHLAFFGGEPLLNPKLIEKILDRFVDNCKKNLSKYEKRLNTFTSSIITNGSLLKTNDTIHLLNKYHDKITVSVTFEGSKNFHDSCRKTIDGKGTYDLVKENMLFFKNKYKKELHPKITISPFNIKYVYEAYLELKKLGIKEIYMKPLIDSNLWNKQHCKIYDEQLKLIVQDLLKDENKDISYTMFKINDISPLEEVINPGCGVGRGSITLNVDGKFYPCYSFTDIEQDKEDAKKFVIGDSEKGIYEYGNNLTNEDLNKWIDLKKLANEDCHQCLLTKYCTPCVANNYKFMKSYLESPTWHCKLLQVQNKWALIYNYLKKEGKSL